MIPPSVNDLEQENIELVIERGPSFIIDRRVLVSGQVERTTGFEPGLPGQHAEIDGQWEPDPWVYDDQSLAINLKDKGLVVITGCGHAGIINIIRHIQQQTGQEKVHGVLGGIHLNGRAFEPVIQPVIDALVEINPEVIVPEHCSGWSATSPNRPSNARRLRAEYCGNHTDLRVGGLGLRPAPVSSTGQALRLLYEDATRATSYFAQAQRIGGPDF